MLGWMLGGAQGQNMIGRLVTQVGGRSHAGEEEGGSLILAVCQDSTANVLGLADIDPWVCGAVGFGQEEDDICLGFKLEKHGGQLKITPLEGAIFLRVLTSA